MELLARRTEMVEAVAAPLLEGRPGGLTLASLEEMALAKHPAIAGAGALIDAANGRWIQAELPTNPTIGYSGQEMSSGNAGQQGVFIGKRFITGNKRGLDQQVAAYGAEMAEHELASMRLRVLTDVRIGFNEAIIAQRRVDLARRLENVSQQSVDTVKKLIHAQQRAPYDELPANLALSKAQLVRNNAVVQLATSWRRLAAIVGDPQLPQQPLDGSTQSHLGEIDWNEQLVRVMSESPERARAIAQIERARWGLSRAEAQAVPDVNVQVSVQHDNSGDRTISGVQFGIPLPLWNRNQGGIQTAEAMVIVAQRNLERIEFDLRNRLASRFEQYRLARESTRMYEQRILPNVEKMRQSSTIGYEKGEWDYLRFLTAQRDYFQENLNYLNSLNKLWTASAQIEGLLLQDSLERIQ